MPTSIEAEANAILHGDGHRQAAQAKWTRLTDADLDGVRTKLDLIATVEQRTGCPHAQALAEVENWACDKRFASWTV